jgi:hypothetical protein
LSARAPWLTPAGWIKREADWNKGTNIRCLAPEQTRGDRLYLADGGYFENSGLETALDLAARLRKVASTDQKLFPFGAEIRIIMVFANDEFLMRWSGADSDLLVRGAGELLEPVETLLMTRIACTRAVHSRAIAFDDANFQSGRYFDRTHKYLITHRRPMRAAMACDPCVIRPREETCDGAQLYPVPEGPEPFRVPKALRHGRAMRGRREALALA